MPISSPVVLDGPVDEGDVGEDEDDVATYLPHHVPGVARHPPAQRLMVGLAGQKCRLYDFIAEEWDVFSIKLLGNH